MATGDAFAAALEARIAGYASQVRGALEGLRSDRRDRWEAVRARVSALTLQLAMARDALERRVGRPVGAPTRERAGEVLGWLTGFDRERHHIEDEIWGLLRAARLQETGVHARVLARAAELHALGRRLRREADEALVEARSSESVRLEDSVEGAAMVRQHERSLAALRSAVEELGVRAGRERARLAGRGLPDFARAVAKLDETLAARVTDGEVAPGRPRAARATRRIERKKAKVPKFLLGRFYRSGGMRAANGSLEITFVNPLGFCIIQGGDPVVVDGRMHPREQTTLDNGERRVGGAELSAASYLKFAKGGEVRVALEGISLTPGKHRVQCSLELRKMGWVDLDVEDRLG
jgi:hypothetical protein